MALDMALGILTAVLMGMECLMFLLKYCKKLKESVYSGSKGKTILKIHEALGFLLAAAAIFHLLTSWKLMRQRPILTYITGIAMTGCIVLAVLSFLLRKQWNAWRVVHHSASGLLLILILVHILCSIISLGQYKTKMDHIEITGINAAGIPDGSYTGVCDVGYIYARVRVEVRNESITDVVLLEHRNERGSRAEAITDDMVHKQNVRVDAVSGATNSSRVIMKAAENALENTEGN